MLFKSAIALLLTWLFCAVYAADIGDIIHVLLLAGLALFLLGVLRARDEALRRASNDEAERK